MWQGTFPRRNSGADGHLWAAPVTSYGVQNSYGLYGMSGNVWEWTASPWCPVKLGKAGRSAARRGNVPWAPSVRVREAPDCAQLSKRDVRKQLSDIGEIDYVKRGGSMMCHKDSCYRYRVAARHKNSINSSAYNLGFRCVYDAAPANEVEIGAPPAPGAPHAAPRRI